jgi:hypothetical protein
MNVKIKLNKYTAPNPTQLITQSNRWITNGPDNEYYYYVEQLYTSSPTNSAIIDTMVNYIMGEGLVDQNGNSIDNILSEDDLRNVITDFKTYGSCVLQVVYTFEQEKKIGKMYYIPRKSVAIAKQDDLSEDIQGYYYSFDWRVKSKYKPYFIPAFGYGEGNETELLVINRPSGQPLFPLADWVSANQWCEMEAEMSNFCINHIKNNFSAGKVVNINKGTVGMTDEDKEETEAYITNNLSGSQNAGSGIVSFKESKEQETTVTNIEIQDAYEQFNGISTEAETKIMLAHKVVSPSLFGIGRATGFANQAEEMDMALKIMYRSQVNPIRRQIIAGLKEALKLNFDNIDFNFVDFDDLKTQNDIAPEDNNEKQIISE